MTAAAFNARSGHPAMHQRRPSSGSPPSPLGKMANRSSPSKVPSSKTPSIKSIMAAGLPSSMMTASTATTAVASDALLLHKSSQSRLMVSKHRPTTSMSSVLGPANTSAITAGNRSNRVSPVKSSAKHTQLQSQSTASKTPAKSPHHGRSKSTLLSKSVGHAASTAAVTSNSRNNAVVTAGGLGRMDVALKDWDGSRSASNSPKKRPQSAKYDRFISSRENSAYSTAMLLEGTINRRADDTFDEVEAADDSQRASAEVLDSFDDSNPPTPQRHREDTDHAHTAELSSSLGIDLGRRILSFAAEPPAASNEHSALLAAYARGEAGVGRGTTHQTAQAASQRRRVAMTADRVLDAPGLINDYYLNLLDWSSTNLLAIALSDSVYIWNAESGDVACLCSVATGEESSDEIVCSVRFSEDGSYLAVGTSSGPVQIYDVSTSSRIRTMSGRGTRVPTLSWSGAFLSSGGRDGSIWNHDVRIAQHKVAEMNGHRGEVCGLEWRKDPSAHTGTSSGPAGATGLLASGGNDNVVNVWDGRMLLTPKITKSNHTGAVKAIAWCPWQPSLLATGGGQTDKTIHFWNTTTSARQNSLLTYSQVTSLHFNPHARELLSSHGHPDHHLSIWSFPSLSKIADIKQAHDDRVLHSCLSPDGTTLATAAFDENLKFWKVFELPKRQATSYGSSLNGKGTKKLSDDLGRRGGTGISIR